MRCEWQWSYLERVDTVHGYGRVHLCPLTSDDSVVINCSEDPVQSVRLRSSSSYPVSSTTPRTPRAQTGTHPTRRSERQRPRGDRDAGRWRHTATCDHPSCSGSRPPPATTRHMPRRVLAWPQCGTRAPCARGWHRPWPVVLVLPSLVCPPAAPAALARNMMRT